MMTAVRQTVTITTEGRLDLVSPELTTGAVAEVIVLLSPRVADQPLPAGMAPTIADRLAALDRLRAMSKLTETQVREWIEDIRRERLAWRIPGDVEP